MPPDSIMMPPLQRWAETDHDVLEELIWAVCMQQNIRRMPIDTDEIHRRGSEDQFKEAYIHRILNPYGPPRSLADLRLP